MSEGTLTQVLAGEATWCVIEGDCLEVLPTIPDRAVAHVITDPPYEAEAHACTRRVLTGLGRAKGESGKRDMVAAVLDFDPIDEETRGASARHLARVSRGWLLVFCQTEAVGKWRDVLVEAGGKWRRAGVWVKTNCMPQVSGDRWAAGHECIASAWCGPGRSEWNGGGSAGVLTHSSQKTGPENRTKSYHPTTKPLPLMLELVTLFTDPGDLVLDAFVGSGTTGVACLRLGRRFIGIEKDAKYAAIARERLRAEANGLSLRDARAGQLPMFGAK